MSTVSTVTRVTIRSGDEEGRRPVSPRHCPWQVFASPEELLQNPFWSRQEKRDALRRWKYEQLELEVAADESMTGKPSQLARIQRALNDVEDSRETGERTATKHGTV